jgi:hypothetical protein
VLPRALRAADDAAAQQGGAAATAQHAAATSSRRQVLSSMSASVVLSYAAAAAAEGFGIDLEKQLPGLPQPAPELPKAYQRTMHKLVKALRDSIEVEAGGAKEFEVMGPTRAMPSPSPPLQHTTHPKPAACCFTRCVYS